MVEQKEPKMADRLAYQLAHWRENQWEQ
jgi:hypothetical protein